MPAVCVNVVLPVSIKSRRFALPNVPPEAFMLKLPESVIVRVDPSATTELPLVSAGAKDKVFETLILLPIVTAVETDWPKVKL